MLEIKFTDKSADGNKNQFPCFMKSKTTGSVVLMVRLKNGYGTGMIVFSKDNGMSDIGDYLEVWDIECFERIEHGSIEW